MNQVAFMQLPNGQVIVQQLPIGVQNVQQPTSMFVNQPGSIPNMGQTLQYFQNESGQVFAINSPAPQAINFAGLAPQQPQFMITPPQPTQYLQVLAPDGSVQLIPANVHLPPQHHPQQQQIVQLAPQPLALTQTAQPQPARATVQGSINQPQPCMEASDATRLHVQQIIQEQQNQILQQQLHQQLQQRQIAIRKSQSGSNTSSNCHQLIVQHRPAVQAPPTPLAITSTAQQTQTCSGSDSEDSLVISTEVSRSTPQPEASSYSVQFTSNSQATVSSTTSIKPKPSISSPSKAQSTSQVKANSLQDSGTSDQSRDSDPESPFRSLVIDPPTAVSSPNSVAQEPESTTQSSTISVAKSSIAETLNNTDLIIVDGVNLQEMREFAKQFKMRRLSLGLTQTQVGQALSATEGPSYSQSAICRFEKLEITARSAQKIKPVLEHWMEEAEARSKSGNNTLTELMSNDSSKKRKRRTSFTPHALDLLNMYFETTTHPDSSQMTALAEKLNYDREVVRVWFCNKRQALRNTIKKLEPSMINATSTAM